MQNVGIHKKINGHKQMLRFKEKIPTDLQILKEIYKNHKHEFCTYSKDGTKTDANIYIPIDIPKVANHFKTTNNIIFGRLYYGMNHKYGYEKIENEQKIKVPIYAPVCGSMKNAINLPMLISVVAGLQEQLSMFYKTLSVSVLAVIISIFSLAYNFNSSESNTKKDEAIVYALNQIYRGQLLQEKQTLKNQEKSARQHKNMPDNYCPKCHTSNLKNY